MENKTVTETVRFHGNERNVIDKRFWTWISGLTGEDYSKMVTDELSDIVKNGKNRIGIVLGGFDRKDKTNFDVKWTLFCKAEKEASDGDGNVQGYYEIAITTSAVIHMNEDSDDPCKWDISFRISTAALGADCHNGEDGITDALEPHIFNSFDIGEICEAFWHEAFNVVKDDCRQNGVAKEWSIDGVSRNKDNSYDVRWRILSTRTDVENANTEEEPKLTRAVIVSKISRRGKIQKSVIFITNGRKGIL